MRSDFPVRKSGEVCSAPRIGSAAFEGFCRMFFACYSPLTVEGRHHLPDGPFLLCSNHSSHADSAALMTASGRNFRSFALLGASDYFFRPRSVRWLVSPWMNVIPIERQPGPKSLAACLAACRQFVEKSGGSLILYPEGTRSADGGLREFKSGVGLIALELGLPVVPAYIEGTHRILPKGQYFPRSGRVTVRFGEVLALAHRGGAGTSREQRHFIAEQLARSIRHLSLAQSNPKLATCSQPGGNDRWPINSGPTNRVI
jgi:1-acyl-sn-glycerol-3-phosphate acyltransferase